MIRFVSERPGSGRDFYPPRVVEDRRTGGPRPCHSRDGRVGPIREVDRWSRVRQGEVGHHRLRQRRARVSSRCGIRSRTPPSRFAAEFRSIMSSVPGVFLGKHLPRLAQLANRLYDRCGVSRTTISTTVGDLPGADRSQRTLKNRRTRPQRPTDFPNSGRCAETGQARGIISLHGGPPQRPGPRSGLRGTRSERRFSRT